MSENYRSRIEKREKKKKTKKDSSESTGAKKPKRSLWKKILLFCLTAGIVLFLVAVGAIWWIIKDAPDLDETLLKDPESSVLLASDGETVIAEVGTEKRYNVTIDQIPEILIDAVIATEDSNFYDHFGIDIKRTIKAVWSTVFGGSTQGGSTITQQVVKNAFLSSEQTVTRKIQEWYLAIQLEMNYSKDEILEMYFNKNLYGGSVYGVAKAAERFFGLSVDELDQLTLEQAAILAGVVQSPNNYTPTVEDNLERLENRRNTVLQLMNRHGYITEEEMEEAQETSIEDNLNVQEAAGGEYQAFIDVAITEAQEKTDANIFEDGLTIYTTLDVEIQQITEDVISTDDYIEFPDNENLETGVVILDTETGAIQAIGGGRNYQAGGYNYATMIERQPGSTAKPLLSYGPAINKLQWSTGHLLTDEEWTYSSGQVVGNSSGNYLGEQTIRTHLASSSNVPALLAYQEVGADYAVEFAQSLGLVIDDEDASNESNPLGTMSTASPLIMAGAYAAFGNGGTYTEPYTVSKIVYSDGVEDDVTPESEQVMEDYTAYMVTDMLRDVVTSGTGTRANVSGIDVAGKTGTTSFDETVIEQYGLPSNAVRDAWFVGYTPQYTAAVWTGYSRTTSSDDYLTTEQSRFSQLIFKEIMSRVATSTETFEQPDSVEEIDGELYVVGSADAETASTAELEAVTNLQASYDEALDILQLSWAHSSDEDTDVSFTVSYTVDGSTTTLTTTSELNASLQNPEVGKTYTFTVVAVSGDETSEFTSISWTMPSTTSEDDSTADEDDTTTEDDSTADEGDITSEDDSIADEGDTISEDDSTADEGDTTTENDSTTDESDTASEDDSGTTDEGDAGTGGNDTDAGESDTGDQDAVTSEDESTGNDSEVDQNHENVAAFSTTYYSYMQTQKTQGYSLRFLLI